MRLALAPSEPVDPATLGVPLKLTVAALALSRIVTVNEPAVFVGIEAIACSVNVKLTLAADVPPTGTLPALPTIGTLANAADAATVATREATSAALVPRLSTFFARFK
jgi:hypothetical protein